MTRDQVLLAEIVREFPRFRLLPKHTSPLCSFIDRFLRVITLGGQSRFMSQYHTVLGETLYVAPTWETMDSEQRYILLRHERIHLRQRRRFGSVAMAFLYLVPFFPLGLAYGRARIEWEAYEETLRATAEIYGIEALDRLGLKDFLVARFTGPDYGFMWPFPNQVSRWYEEARDRIQTEMMMTQPVAVSQHRGRR